MIRRSTKSISFLMEFIIVVFFFALSSAICVSVYANAERMNTQANDKKMAIMLAQNYVETIKEQSETYLQYDHDGNPTNKDAYFVLEVTSDVSRSVNEVSVSCNEEILITLQYANFGGETYEE